MVKTMLLSCTDIVGTALINFKTVRSIFKCGHILTPPPLKHFVTLNNLRLKGLFKNYKIYEVLKR